MSVEHVVVDSAGGADRLGQDDIEVFHIVPIAAGGTCPHQDLTAIIPAELRGVDQHGRSAHSDCHHRYPYSLKHSRIAVRTPHIIHKHRIFQIMFRDILRPVRISYQDDPLRNFADFGMIMHRHLYSRSFFFHMYILP